MLIEASGAGDAVHLTDGDVSELGLKNERMGGLLLLQRIFKHDIKRLRHLQTLLFPP